MAEPSRGAGRRLKARETSGLAGLFKVLGSPARLRLLHALVSEGEARAGDLARAAGLSPQAASNQLRRLDRLSIVAARRRGAEMHYRVINSCIAAIMEKGLCVVRKEC